MKDAMRDTIGDVRQVVDVPDDMAIVTVPVGDNIFSCNSLSAVQQFSVFHFRQYRMRR